MITHWNKVNNNNDNDNQVSQHPDIIQMPFDIRSHASFFYPLHWN